MYSPFKRLALSLLKAPSDPPEPPAGTHESIQVFRASPRYLTYRMLGFWLRLLFAVALEAFVLLGGLASGESGAVAFGVLAFVFLTLHLFFHYFAIRIDWDLRYYVVTDRAIRVRQGAWIVKEMTITHANVQNLRVVQGPIERLFRISTLQVDTAGGGGAAADAQGVLSGHTVRMVGIENAHEVRDLILAHLRRRGGGAGLGDQDDHDERASVAPTSAAMASPAALAALRALRDSAGALRAAAEAAR